MTEKLHMNCEEHISCGDYGLLYGFSIFETFLVDRTGIVFCLEEHMERMLNSACFFGIECRASVEELQKKVNDYIIRNKLNNIVLRVTLSAGNKSAELEPVLSFFIRQNNYTPEIVDRGCKLCLTPYKKNKHSQIIRHKTANYLENFLLQKEAINKGFDDVIFENTDMNVTETTKSNVFFVRNNALHTPATSCGLLPGITRGWIIRKAAEVGLDCNEGQYGIDDFINASEVFVCNSVAGIMHVPFIEKHCIGKGICGHITKLLKRKYLNELKA